MLLSCWPNGNDFVGNDAKTYRWGKPKTDEENPGTIILTQPQFPLLLCPKESSVAKFSKTHYLSWVPSKNFQSDFFCEERSRTSQKMKATSTLSAELLLCNFRSSFDKRISCCQDFQNALPLLATFRRQRLQKFEMAGAYQIQDSTATESNTSFSQESF